MGKKNSFPVCLDSPALFIMGETFVNGGDLYDLTNKRLSICLKKFYIY